MFHKSFFVYHYHGYVYSLSCTDSTSGALAIIGRICCKPIPLYKVPVVSIARLRCFETRIKPVVHSVSQKFD